MRRPSAVQCQWLLLQLLLLSGAARSIVASPVTSPEIASKSAKAASESSASTSVSVNQPQPHQAWKSSPQEAHLNSLNAYASSYDSLPASHFKPSYKLPELETNFTPLQSGSILGDGGQPPSPQHTHSTPMLMQYLPQSLNDGGSVQYLQLIPTRPLIVPISPFLSGGGAAPVQPLAAAYHQPLAAGNALAEYAPRPAPLLTALPANNVAAPAPVSGPLLEIPYGQPTYANAVPSYRGGYRINREIKENNLPPGMSLNLNEYLPGPNTPAHAVYIRSRP